METQLMWGWQSALYLFLGGMGAGAFLVVGVLYLRDCATDRNLLAASTWAALACVGVGLMLLLSELSAPLRGLMMWQSFSHFTSWMTFGAWLAFAAMVLFFVCALLLTKPSNAFLKKAIPALERKEEGVLRVLVVAGMVFAAGVAVYTGMLLMSAPGIGLWNTPLLPCLFTVSAVDTGVALVELIALACVFTLGEPSERFLRRCVVALVCIEMVVVAAFCVTSASGSPSASYSAGVLLTGEFALPFWAVFVSVGLALPLLAAFLGLRVSSPQGVPVAQSVLSSQDAPAPASAEASAPAALQGIRATQDGQDASAQQPESACVREAGERDAPAPRARRGIAALTCVGALGALVGGCALRFLVLFAGAHADLVAATIAALPL